MIRMWSILEKVSQADKKNVCKWKNEICGNQPRKGGREVKENDGGGEFNYDIFDIL
jgi:hypothetical protein